MVWENDDIMYAGLVAVREIEVEKLVGWWIAADRNNWSWNLLRLAFEECSAMFSRPMFSWQYFLHESQWVCKKRTST